MVGRPILCGFLEIRASQQSLTNAQENDWLRYRTYNIQETMTLATPYSAALGHVLY